MQISLKAARVNKKMTQKEAAALLGVTADTVGKWERGITCPDAKQLITLMKIYEISYDNLYL